MSEKGLAQIINKGTTQSSRSFEALDENYFMLDERTVADWLVFASDFSKLVNFYDLDGKVRGDWSSFFNDELIVLASIELSDPSEIEKNFQKNQQKALKFKRESKKKHYLTKCIRSIYDIVLRFESWLHRLKQVEDFTRSQLSVRNEVLNAVSDKLGEGFKTVYLYAKYAEQELDHPIDLDYAPLKFFSEYITDIEEENPYEGNSLQKKLDNTTLILAKVFQSFYETLFYLKSQVPSFFRQSLENREHFPDMALYITFLQLFEQVQGKLNNISSRYLEYYYIDHLDIAFRRAVKDHVYLRFTPDGTKALTVVPKGTVLLGGEDEEGEVRNYITEEPLMVNKIKVEKLCNYFINYDNLSIKGVAKPFLSGVYTSSIPIGEGSANPDADQLRKTYPVFGEDQTLKGAFEKTMELSNLGFAISSPSFRLSEGHRSVMLSFQFTPETFKVLQKDIKDIAGVNDYTEEETFLKLFLNAFILSVTTEEGWYDVSKYVVSLEPEKYMFHLGFDMESDEPSILDYNEEVHKGNYEAPYPVLKILLASDNYLNVYSLLYNLDPDQLLIHTDIKGIKDVLLYNHLSQLSLDTPFFPFGPDPKIGHYMLIGHKEVFGKSPDSLRINIDWFNLPDSAYGFKEYFQEYKVGLDNSDYEVELSILDRGKWRPFDDDKQKFKLFRTEDRGAEEDPQPDSTLLPQTTFGDIDITKIKQPADLSLEHKDLLYTNLTQRGFVKLEITSPKFGFGHSVYAGALSRVMKENSRKSFLQKFKKTKKEEPLPNEPFSPQAKSISLDYTASSAILFDDRGADNPSGFLYHIHPQGVKQSFPAGGGQKVDLLPKYDFQGALMIGLAGYEPPQTVTLFFELQDEETETSESNPPVVEWSYLIQDDWVNLEPSKILRDETNSFIQTGIIEVDLPYDMTKGSNIMDPEFHWLRIVVNANQDQASRLVNLSTQVVKASLTDGSSTEHLAEGLPANSIEISMENINGIEAIKQPLPSFGGRPEEYSEDFYTRGAERLRHKQRAISLWDYERLILSEFEDIMQVNCLPNTSSTKLKAVGNVMLVTVMKPEKATVPAEPQASNEMLYRVKDYIKQFTSPFVQLEVRNPEYERIKVVCAVKFKSGFSFGFYLQELNKQIHSFFASATEGERQMELGGRLHCSDVMSFMRTLPYIESIDSFSMLQSAVDLTGKYVLIDTARAGDEKDFLIATKPWAILVSASEHHITVQQENEFDEGGQSGVGRLDIGNDFIIN